MKQEQLFAQPALCCGCEACVNICPRKVLEMQRDCEGFYYPSVVNPDACVACHACERVCPVKHADELHAKFSEAYCGWAKTPEDVVRSSSGGAAAVLARDFLNRGGIVYGVSYSKDFRQAIYQRVDRHEQLDGLRGSKYFQARKNDSFRRICEDLKTMDVLFFGLPCDCYALTRYVKDRSRLTVVSLICHGPTSELVQQCFCDALEKNAGSRLTGFSMRYKVDGQWKPYYLLAEFEEGEAYCEPFNKTDYNKAFLYFKRPSCETCQFKKKHHAADLILGDHHGADPGNSDYNEHGVSVLFPLTERGKLLMEGLRNAFELHPLSLRRSIGQQGLVAPVSGLKDREIFADVMHEKGLATACALETVCERAVLTKDKAVKKRFRRQQLLWRFFRI